MCVVFLEIHDADVELLFAARLEIATTQLTEERIRLVVAEHQRLMRKLKRMPAAHVILQPDRLPGVAGGEKLEHVIRGQVDPRVADVMRAIDALQPDYMRVQGIYHSVVWLGADDAIRDARAHEEESAVASRAARPWDAMVGDSPTEDEVRAVAACLAEIERAEPRLKTFRKVAESRRR